MMDTIALTAGVLIAALVTVAAVVQLTTSVVRAEPQQPAGSRIAMTVPPGFTRAKAYSGFENPKLSASFVIMEMPGHAYDQIKAGFNANALATKGIKNVELKALNRPGEHLYLTGVQPSPIGDIAKFMLVIRSGDVAALISGNIPQTAIASGALTIAAIETAMTGAEIKTTAAAEDALFELRDLGSFKPAGAIVGTTRAYTLDGVLSPPAGQKKTDRELFMVAPSLDARPIGDLADFTRAALPSLVGVKAVQIAKMTPVTIAGMKGLAATATGSKDDDDKPVHVYHVVLVNPNGGYYRLVGMTYQPKPEARLAEFERMAQSFQLIKR